jgi:SAM-dependent methyltransferase
MKKEAFDLMKSGEDSWWYVGRQRVVLTLLRCFSLDKNNEQKLLDVGAGFGSMFQTLTLFGSVDAFEPEERLHEVLEKCGYRSLFLTWKDVFRSREKYDVVGAFDVVEHSADEDFIISNMYQALRVGGRIIVSVPAYQWLWSKHDEINNHYRRYTKKMLNSSLKRAGFEVEYISYWNTFLFPLALVARLLNSSGGAAFTNRGFINRLFVFVVSLEAYLMRFVSLPFGLSVFAVAKKI